MKSLGCHIEDVFKEKSWAYYSQLETYELDKIIQNPEKFILDYLGYGMKKPTELINVNKIELSPYRLYHTISIFWLGLIIYGNCENIKTAIDNYLVRVNDEMKALDNNIVITDVCEEFSYSWFIMCFMHDFMSEFKREKLNQGKTLFQEYLKNKIEEQIKENINNIVTRNMVPDEITKNLIKYLEYRKIPKSYNKDEFLDHGIVAGTYFYYDRKEQLRKVINYPDVQKYNENTFKYKNLFWSKYILENLHKDIALVIAGHNVWFKRVDENPDYKKHKLQDLETDKPVYKMNELPMYFLFTLVDTIDFYKRESELYEPESKKRVNLSTEECCQIYNDVMKYSLEFTFDGFVIKCKEIDKINDFYQKQEYWLPIKVKKGIDTVIVTFT